MKRIAVALCAALVTGVLAAATPSGPLSPANIGWAVAMTKQQDKMLLMKVRLEIPNGAEPEKYLNAIEMHWKYEPDDKGMPAERVVAQFERLEAAIDPIQGDRAGYLMMIATGGGERIWLWYVADPKDFAAELNRLLPGHPFPITLKVSTQEPDWKTYRAMRAKVTRPATVLVR